MNPAKMNRGKVVVHPGFTLLELLVVIAILSLLAGLILPAVNHAKARGAMVRCLNNLRQLQLCWQSYSDDHGGALPPNQALQTNGIWRSTPDSWIGDSSAPHDADTSHIQNGLFFKLDYNRSANLYRCPADQAIVRAPGGKDLGLPRTRSYSMNGNLGGRVNERQDTVWTASQIPHPSQLFVLVDEHPDSIDDAHFLVWPAPDNRWVNLPADRHRQGCNLSFADGRVEHWRWLTPKSFAPKSSYWKAAGNMHDLRDLRRIQTVILHYAL